MVFSIYRDVDKLDSYFHPDLQAHVLITFEAVYNSDYEVAAVHIFEVHEIAQSGDKREVDLSLNMRLLEEVKELCWEHAESKWRDAKDNHTLEKADADLDFRIEG